MKDKRYYPEEWPDELVRRLERQPRWKRYFWPPSTHDKTVYVTMLQNWQADHGGLIEALKLIDFFEGKSPFISLTDGDQCSDVGSALQGIHQALSKNMDDLDDIIYYIRETWDQYGSEHEPEDSKAETGSSKISSLNPGR